MINTCLYPVKISEISFYFTELLAAIIKKHLYEFHARTIEAVE
jgi:hypothetical protein